MKLSILRQVTKYQLETNDLIDIREAAKDIMARDLAVAIIKRFKIQEIPNNGGLDLRVDFHVLSEAEHFLIQDLVSQAKYTLIELENNIT